MSDQPSRVFFDQTTGRVTRETAAPSFPLHSYPPGALTPPPPQAPPPEPTEPELRGALAAACDALRAAEQALSEATAAHERGGRHVEQCKANVARLATIDQTATDAVIAALRSGSGRIEPDENLRQQMVDRDLARADLLSGESALSVLRADLAIASQTVGTATRNVDTAVAKLLALAAADLGYRHAHCRAEMQVIAESLNAVDRFLRAAKVALPARAGIALQQVDGLHHRPDLGPWQRLVDALKASPLSAEIEIALPDIVVPELPQLVGYSFTTIAVPIAASVTAEADAEE